MSSRRPRLAPRARADVRRIVRHSRKTWGDRQARVYQAKLDAAFERIAEYPGIGGVVPNAPDHVRRLTVEQHHVYYLIDEIGVLVLRVMHVRMDDPDLGV